MSQSRYHGKKTSSIVHVEKKRVFNIKLRLFLIVGKNNPIIIANKKKVSYLNHKKPDNLNSKNGR